MSQGTRSFFFGATLSEIGFILFFALLLFAFFQREVDSQIIEEDRTQIEELRRELVHKEEALALKDKALENYEKLALLTPEEQGRFFDELVPIVELQLENENLEKENEGLITQLEEYSDVRETLKEFAEQNERPESEIREALLLIEAVEKAIDNDNVEVSAEKLADALKYAEVVERFNQESGATIDDQEALHDLLVTANSAGEYKRALDDAKGKLKFFAGRGGLDLPPCWPNRDTGRPEYLFNFVILDEGVLGTKAAPEHRENEYASLVNTNEMTSGLMDLPTFRQLAAPILQIADSMKCRYYVTISDKSKYAYKEASLAIEDYFYRYVNRN